jgi:hypothetical protein
MKKSAFFALVVVAATAFACSLPTPKDNSNDKGGTSGQCDYDLSQALQIASGAGSACASCVQSHCGSQISTYQGSGGCGPYLSCICPGGTATTDQATIESCANQEQTSGCSASVTAFNNCVDNSCGQPCNRTSTNTDGG